MKGNSDKPAHKIYKETVTEGQSVTDKPRNIRQLHYIREKARTEERPTKDAITNLQAMAYEDEGFIHYIAAYPDLVCIAGLEEMLYIWVLYYRWSQKKNSYLATTQHFQWETFMCPLCYSNIMLRI